MNHPQSGKSNRASTSHATGRSRSYGTSALWQGSARSRRAYSGNFILQARSFHFCHRCTLAVVRTSIFNRRTEGCVFWATARRERPIENRSGTVVLCRRNVELVESDDTLYVTPVFKQKKKIKNKNNKEKYHEESERASARARVPHARLIENENSKRKK